MKLSKVDVLVQVCSIPETSWQIHHDVEAIFGETDHNDVQKRLEELAEEGRIQSAQQKLKDGGVHTVYWR